MIWMNVVRWFITRASILSFVQQTTHWFHRLMNFREKHKASKDVNIDTQHRCLLCAAQLLVDFDLRDFMRAAHLQISCTNCSWRLDISAWKCIKSRSCFLLFSEWERELECVTACECVLYYLMGVFLCVYVDAETRHMCRHYHRRWKCGVEFLWLQIAQYLQLGLQTAGLVVCTLIFLVLQGKWSIVGPMKVLLMDEILTLSDNSTATFSMHHEKLNCADSHHTNCLQQSAPKTFNLFANVRLLESEGQVVYRTTVFLSNVGSRVPRGSIASPQRMRPCWETGWMWARWML